MAGLFISFEGSEGCGKSTQVKLLAGRLQGEGAEVVRTREPGGTALGERVRTLLQHTPEVEGMTPEAELLLFSASRAELVRTVIEPALRGGSHVLSDRFVDSTMVYQGVGRALGVEVVEGISYFATGGRLPHRTFLLDLPVEACLERLRRRQAEGYDRFEAMPGSFFEEVRQGYLALAARHPHRIRVLDGAMPEESLAEIIWGDVESFLHGTRV